MATFPLGARVLFTNPLDGEELLGRVEGHETQEPVLEPGQEPERDEEGNIVRIPIVIVKLDNGGTVHVVAEMLKLVTQKA